MLIGGKAYASGQRLGSFWVYNKQVHVTASDSVTLVVYTTLPGGAPLTLAIVRVDLDGNLRWHWSNRPEFHRTLERNPGLRHHVVCRAELLWQHLAFEYRLDPRLGVVVGGKDAPPRPYPLVVETDTAQLTLVGAAA